MKVCEKVEGKGRTTYNEVADELVNDLPGQHETGAISMYSKLEGLQRKLMKQYRLCLQFGGKPTRIIYPHVNRVYIHAVHLHGERR